MEELTEEMVDKLLLKLTKDEKASKGARDLAKAMLEVSPVREK